MSTIIPNRSMLHKLNPIGLGTPAVESLVSYFCRLANSHSCSTMDLAQLVIEHIAPERWSAYQSMGGKNRFVWYERSISGIGQSAQLWAETLSTLTSTPSLSWLTMTPLQTIVASKGMMSTQERWCPHCFNEDLLQNKTPYFRLAWDIGINKICHKHQVALTEHCPHCKKNNIRHSSNFVVPGWCTACRHFLGLQEPETPPLLDEIELERTQEIENLLMLFSEPGLSTDLSILHKTIETLIQKLDNDVNAHFAKRIGVQKSSVHYWRSKQSTLTFEALLQIAMRCNISIVELIQGDLSCWIPIETPVERKNTKSQLSFSHTKNSTSHDWNEIRHYLQQELNRQNTPRSVAEIARELGISKRSLYIYARKETGLLGQRYLRYRQEQGKRNLVECHEILTNACKYVRKQGHGISARRITPIVDAEILSKTPAFYSMLSQIAQEIELRA